MPEPQRSFRYQLEKAVPRVGAGGATRGASGHYIRNTGTTLLRVLIGFNDGEYQSNDLSAWLASNPLDVLSTNLGLSREVAAKLPREGLFITTP